MKKTLLMALAVSLTLPVGTAAFAKSKPSRPDSSASNTINISCYRGAFRSTVAWDRANAVFIEDLMKYGYSLEDATNIGERVCRDEYGVGNSEHKIETLKKMMRETPPSR